VAKTTRKTGKAAAKLSRLKEILAGKKSMLIVLQDNPDPDAIAAGVGLRELANHLFGISCSLVHGGLVGRVENRALAKYVGVNLRHFEEIDATNFDMVAMVDTQPNTGNNALPNGTPIDVLVDHHPMRKASRGIPFTDIRKHYGAASTIIFEYLAEAGVEIDAPTATALLYGIRSDTQELGRDATRADIRAHLALYQLANSRMLGQITHAALPDDYYRILHTALENARRNGRGIYTSLGEIEDTDMISEVADLFLRNENVQFSLVIGSRQGAMHLSLRTSVPEADAGRIMSRIVSRKGTGGGHRMMAGGQIPLGEVTSDGARKRLERTIVRRFLKITGETASRCRLLVPRRTR